MVFRRPGLWLLVAAWLPSARAESACTSSALCTDRPFEAFDLDDGGLEEGSAYAISVLQHRLEMVSWGSSAESPKPPAMLLELASRIHPDDGRQAKVGLPQPGGWSPLCPGVSGALPTGAALLVMLVALGLLRVHVRQTHAEQAARSIYLMLNFVLVMNYTVVILDSYDLCIKIGLDSAASGRMVGMYMLGFCAGAGAMWLQVKQRPDLWREAPQRVLVVGLIFQLVGAVAYTWVAREASGLRHGDTLSPPLKDFRTLAVMLPRFISGIGSGSCQQFYVSGMLHITPAENRTMHTARWVFSGMLAIGLGPVIAALEQELELCQGDGPHFALAGETQIVVAVGSMIAVAWLHPDLTDCCDCLTSDSEEGDSTTPPSTSSPTSPTSRGHRWHRRLIVCGCLCMASLRAFGVSAIEVVIAEILEERFGWDQRATGVTIGAIFLCCIPMKIVHSVMNESLPVVTWIRVLAACAFMGSTMLFASATKVTHLGGAQQLIVGGIIVFPTLYLSDALSSGLMHQHVLSTGSLFDGNHAQLWYNLMQGIGRFLGPWIARWCVEAYGQDSFAAQQMVVTLVFVFVFETMVRPFLKAGKPEAFAPMRQVSM